MSSGSTSLPNQCPCAHFPLTPGSPVPRATCLKQLVTNRSQSKGPGPQDSRNRLPSPLRWNSEGFFQRPGDRPLQSPRAWAICPSEYEPTSPGETGCVHASREEATGELSPRIWLRPAYSALETLSSTHSTSAVPRPSRPLAPCSPTPGEAGSFWIPLCTSCPRSCQTSPLVRCKEHAPFLPTLGSVPAASFPGTILQLFKVCSQEPSFLDQITFHVS